jgi:hypothetical protein
MTGLTYKLYSFGIFSHDFLEHAEALLAKKIITCNLNYTQNGLEYVVYAYNDMVNDLEFKNHHMPDVSLSEFYLIRDILYSLFYYTENELSEMVYNSKPVKELGIIPRTTYRSGRTLLFE